MDKIQRWLKRKEAESPSPSLRDSPATLRDRLKTARRSIARVGRIGYVSPKTHEYLKPWETENQERLKELYHEREPKPKQEIPEEKFREAREKILEALRNPRITWSYGRRDNLDFALLYLKDCWDDAGCRRFELAKEPLLKMRKRLIKPLAKKYISQLRCAIGKEGVTKADLIEPLEALSFLYESAGARFNTNRLWTEVLEEYPKNAPYVPLSEIKREFPNAVIAHGVPMNGNKRSLDNNLCIKCSASDTYIDFLGFLLDNKPTISCSSTEPGAPAMTLYSRVGVILNGGNIHNANPGDSVTITYAPNVKLPSHRQTGTLKEQIRSAVSQRKGRYNELIVSQPEVAGIYFSDGITREGRWEYVEYLGVEQTEEQVLTTLAKLAIQRGLPLYKHSQGTGFIEVNPRELLQAA